MLLTIFYFIFFLKNSFNSFKSTISCSILSLNLTVTLFLAKLSLSIVTQNGVQISSNLAYLFPIVPTSSYSHIKSSDNCVNTFFASSPIFLTTGRTQTLIGATFGSSFKYILVFSPSPSVV